MKIDKIRQKSKAELQRTLEEKREGLRMLRFDLTKGKLKNIKEIRGIKRDIARILTIIKEKKE